MREDLWFKSKGKGNIHGCRWATVEKPRAVVQIVHGIAEYIERYDEFANFLTKAGFLVVGEDHMGHGQSIRGGSVQGYFHGGWFSAVEDTYQLLKDTMAAYPGVPYILLGHSMGSFMTRTILCTHPDSGISAAVICGTGWQPAANLAGLVKLLNKVVLKNGEAVPNPRIERLVFGSYNRKVEHPRTAYDWINRNSRAVDEYVADPLCGFIPSGGLMMEMVKGIGYIQRKTSLATMNKDLPVFFIAGGDDPVGDYGKGVRKAAEAFRRAGMSKVKERIYPLCRHEILNEINKAEIWEDVLEWMESILKESRVEHE